MALKGKYSLYLQNKGFCISKGPYILFPFKANSIKVLGKSIALRRYQCEIFVVLWKKYFGEIANFVGKKV